MIYVVVDQMSQDLFETLAPSYQGGFRRMLDDGSSAVARHHHAITFTCPGHATLSTGVAPSVHGVVGNEWKIGADTIYCADPAFLRVQTLGDRVHDAGGRVVALSLKDRGAIMLGGSSPDLVSWWDSSAATWLSKPPQPWLSGVDATPWRRKAWTAARPDLYTSLGVADSEPWERDPGGLGLVFPHPAADELPPKSFLATPHSGSALTDLAIAALDGAALGTDVTPDLLAISYSQVDYVGHAFSGRSWEAFDTMLALDADLARLMDALDARIPGQWAIVVSADHGAAPPSESRFSLKDVTAACDDTLVSLELTAGCTLEEPSLWLPPEVRTGSRKDEAARAVAAAISKMPGVDGFAWRAADGLPAGFAHAESLRLSFDDERSGDVYVLYEPGWIPKYAGTEYAGTSHGTPYDYDQRVPFLAYGAGVKKGPLASEVDTRAIAATAGALIGLALPGAAPPVDAALE